MYVKIVYRNLKSENSKDYAQKSQRNCPFMNSVSGATLSVHWFAGTGMTLPSATFLTLLVRSKSFHALVCWYWTDSSFSNFSHIAGTEQLSPCIGLLVLTDYSFSKFSSHCWYWSNSSSLVDGRGKQSLFSVHLFKTGVNLSSFLYVPVRKSYL
jgi:hypothetical protein